MKVRVSRVGVGGCWCEWVCASAGASGCAERAGEAHRGVALRGGGEQRRAAIGRRVDGRLRVEKPCRAARVPERSGLEQGRTAIGEAAIHIHTGAGRKQLDHLCVAALDGRKQGGKHSRCRLVEELAHRGRVAQDARPQHLGGEPLVVQLALWSRRGRGRFLREHREKDPSICEEANGTSTSRLPQ